MLCKILLSLVACISFTLKPHAQKSYRAKSVNTIDFLLPSHAKLGKEGLFCRKQSLQYHPRFRYQRVFIQHLNGNNYSHFQTAISLAEYEHDNLQIPPARLQNYYGTTDYAGTVVNPSARIYFSDQNNGFILEMDYGAIIAGADPVNYFKTLFLQLLAAFRVKETAPPNWPSTICQDIVPKIFELLPVPVESSVAGLGFVQTPQYSILLLHPRFAIQVDHNILDDRTVIPTDGTAATPDWKYVMTGQTTIPLYKFQNGAGSVFFRQAPFLHADVTRNLLFDNLYKQSSVHLSSSADMELSQRISTSPYLFLYQRYMAGNNSESTAPSSTIGDCCQFGNGAHCSSLILFRQNPDELVGPIDYCNMQIAGYASFGEHSLIVPVIPVYIGGNLTYQPLGLKLSDLVSNHLVTVRNKLEREDKSKYRTVKKNSNNIWLLPGDRITNL